MGECCPGNENFGKYRKISEALLVMTESTLCEPNRQSEWDKMDKINKPPEYGILITMKTVYGDL